MTQTTTQDALSLDTPLTDDVARRFLSVATLNALLNADKRTVGAALAIDEDELACIRNLGPAGRAQVQQLRIALRDGEELARLRAFRDEAERAVRAAPGSPVFTAADATYLRVLASYGGRAVTARWLYDFAGRIDSTLALLAAPTPDRS
ncbi:MAG: hypothetical protein HOQ34_18425 [Gemmatimonadaceae bacterium]|nr:hypothetical protein [Gemmatimonadaceae bacterium]